MIHSHTKRGFTLVELLVSVGIFSVVMMIALGALLAISESDRRAETLKSVINNLNFSLDSMTRSIRTGTNYDASADCGSPSGTDCTAPPGSISLRYKDAGGHTVVYKLQNATVMRSVDGATFAAITAPEVVISKLAFYVVGSPTGDGIQPKVNILLSGSVAVTSKLTSQFNLQTSVTQRVYDQ